MPGTIIRALRDAEPEQPAADDRRDRQDGHPTTAATRRARCSRSSTPSRTRPSATTTWTCRSTSREVMFITTANAPRHHPAGRCRDRMEVIQLRRLRADEKLEIAKRYLVPRQLERHGLRAQLADLRRRRRCATLIDELHARGRRPQPRARDRRVLRKIAREVVEADRAARQAATSDGAKRGPAPHPSPRTGRGAARPPAASPSCASGQPARRRPPAWRGRRSAATCCSSRPRLMPGKGRLTITGQLGDVMKRVGAGGADYVRGHLDAARRLEPAARTGSPSTTCTSTCPPARCPKDGPSAGHHDRRPPSARCSPGREVRPTTSR